VLESRKADGFFEWKDADGGPKQPYLLRRPDGSPLGLAGLWEHWQDPEGNELETCTILTTEPNAEVESIHNRMPVIIDPGDYGRWLDTGAHGPGDVADLLRPAPDGTLELVPVSRRVNNPRHDDPGCVEPAG